MDTSSKKSSAFGLSGEKIARLLSIGREDDLSGVERKDEYVADLRIEGYEIIEKVAEAGQGQVWRALQQSTGRDVAIKVPKIGSVASERARIRFEREIELAARLKHPNIARIYDSGVDRGQYYYVMDFVEGSNLDDYVRKHDLTHRQILELMRTICEAVQHAHQNGIIHRDLKPSNIIVTDDGRPFIVDFGLAKGFWQDDQNLAASVDGETVGTPAYMSPEQAAGHTDKVDTRTDVYSLGVTLFILLTGSNPHDLSGSHLEVIHRIADDEVRRPRALNRHIDKDMEALLLKALDRDPDRRYSSAAGLTEDIDNYLKGEPLIAGPLTVSYRFNKFVRRNKRVFAGVVIVAAALMIGLTVSVVSLVREHHARLQAQANELEMRRIAYASDMSLAQKSLEMNDMGRAHQLLDAHRPAADEVDLRGWEWRYLWQQCRSDALGGLCRYEKSQARSVAYSPDGSVLAVSGLFPGFVDIWDVPARKLIRRLQQNQFSRVAFSPHGDLLLTKTEDQIRFWRTDTWDLIRQVSLTGKVLALKFSPDGTCLASLILPDELTVWEVNQSEALRPIPGLRLPKARLGRFDFSPDSKSLVIGDADGHLQGIDLANGDTIFDVVEAHPEQIETVVWSPNSSVIASGSAWEGGAIKLWDAASGKSLGMLEGHTSWITDIVFSKDGLRLYSASGDQTIRIWDVRQRRPLATLRGSRHEVLGLALSPDGTTLASGCKDGTVAFWSADPLPREEWPRVIPLGRFARPAFAPDSRVLAVPQASTVSLFDLATSKGIKQLPKMDTDVTAIAYSPDGTLLVSGSEKGTIRVCSCAGGRPPEELDGHKEQIVLLRFRADGARMLSLDATGNVIWWDALTWHAGQRFEVELPPRLDRSWPVDLSPDSRLLAFRTKTGAVGWVDAETGELLDTTGDGQSMPQLAFSGDGLQLAGTFGYGTVALWNSSSFRSVTSFRAHLMGAHGVAFSPDSRRLATGGGTSRDAVKLWDLSTRRELITLRGQGACFRPLVFSNDGRWLAVCSSVEGNLHLWRAPSWEEIEAEEKKRESGQSL